MTFISKVNEPLRVRCNGGCGTVLAQHPKARAAGRSLDFMRNAGWTIGSSLCPPCREERDARPADWREPVRDRPLPPRPDPWDNVVETAPGIWVPKPEGRDTPGQARPARRRRIRKLL